MNCKLIFYSAQKTALCERSLCRDFSGLNIRLLEVKFATESEELGAYIEDAFQCCDLVFVVGGFSLDGDKGIESILSRALAKANVDIIRRLHNKGGNDGYLFTAGNQLLVVLPDAPFDIQMIMQGPVSSYIKNC